MLKAKNLKYTMVKVTLYFTLDIAGYLTVLLIIKSAFLPNKGKYYESVIYKQDFCFCGFYTECEKNLMVTVCTWKDRHRSVITILIW